MNELKLRTILKLLEDNLRVMEPEDWIDIRISGDGTTYHAKLVKSFEREARDLG